jgi:hypothetical protein
MAEAVPGLLTQLASSHLRKAGVPDKDLPAAVAMQLRQATGWSTAGRPLAGRQEACQRAQTKTWREPASHLTGPLLAPTLCRLIADVINAPLFARRELQGGGDELVLLEGLRRDLQAAGAEKARFEL